MNWNIIKHDFKRNKAINFGLLLFIWLSATLTVVSTLVAVQTFTSITELYEVAQPPHYLQMHKGDIDTLELAEFMDNDARVEDWQVVTMIDVLGDQLTLHQNDASIILSDFRLDIGMVVQNEEKDLLLNDQHEKVIIEPGYIGIPVLMKTMYDIQIGDTLTLSNGDFEKTWIISHVILDAQMNSPMTSSTRILLNDQDFIEVNEHFTEVEYLIEVFFFDKGVATAFQTDYQNALLAQDGQAVTYTMILILSAFTDMVTVFVMLVVSGFLVVMSFVCVRFTMLSAIEEEIVEIGTMKAIGLSNQDVRSIYLGKYRLLSIFGTCIGYITALFTVPLFSNHISTTFGDVPLSSFGIGLSVLTAGILIFIIISYAKRVLKQLKKLTVVETLVKGQGMGKAPKIPKRGLERSFIKRINLQLAIREVTYYFKSWAVVFFLILIATLMVLIPINIVHTFESDDFITYMGTPKEDILIEVNPGNELNERFLHVISVIEQTDEVVTYDTFKTIRMQTLDQDGELFNLNIDSGEKAGDGLNYLEGHAPISDQEIALSFLNADYLGVNQGDTLSVLIDGVEETFVISGIYQDVTSGGFTGKIKRLFPDMEGESYSLSVDVSENTNPKEIADLWKSQMGVGVKVLPMDLFISQTLGGVTKQLQFVVYGIYGIAIALVMLSLSLFLKLRFIKDFAEVATLKAIGFSQKDINSQYMMKIGFVTLLGLGFGSIFAIVLGNPLVNIGLGFSGLGIKEIELSIHVWMIFVTITVFTALALMMTQLGLRQMKTYKIMSLINE